MLPDIIHLVYLFYGRALTEEKASMSERTLNAIMTVKSAMKTYKNKPELVPITKELLALARNACQHYKNYLEEEKRIQQEEANKKVQERQNEAQKQEIDKKLEKTRIDISKYEAELSLKNLDVESKRQAGNKLFDEANERLKKAMNDKNMEQVQLAQAMLEGVRHVRQEEAKEKQEADTIKKLVVKRKSALISHFFTKKTKK